MNAGKRKAQNPYFADKKFVPRIKEFLESTERQADVEDIVDYLRGRYPEYARKKWNTLKLSTLKALNNIDFKNNQGEEKTKQLEERYLNKRQKSYDSKFEDDDSVQSYSDSDCNDNEMLVQYKDTNVVNNSMQDLYKNLSTQSSSRPINELKVKDIDKGNLSWTIDKTPTYAENTFKVVSAISQANETPTKLSNGLESIDSSLNPQKTPSSQLYQDIHHSDIDSSVNAAKLQLSTISEDERSLPSRPATPLSKSLTKSARKKSESSKQKKFEPAVSKVSFKDVGGCDACLQEVSKLLFHLKHPEVFKQLGIKPPRGFLLHGAPGCGKTLLANAIAGELQIPFFKIAAPEVVSGISGESEQKVRSLFAEALMVAPSILFIDEIDSITPKRDTAGKESERRVVTQILTCMDELASADSHVLVIGATNRADSLDPALRRAGRFDREIAMGIPDKTARKSILEVICRDLRLASDFNYELIASKTPGFVGADMQALTREAAMCAVDNAFQLLGNSERLDTSDTIKTNAQDSGFKEPNSTAWLRDQPPLSNEQLQSLYITTEHFEKALPHVQPSAKREGFATVPDVSWDDIGALEDIREELTMAIMAPVQNPAEFESLGLTTPPGILLAGPPGCGKTLLAKAIANEAGINFISVKGPELLNMYVGESEKAVRQVFERARNSSPCVIFFDEIDALCPRRSQTGDSSASSRVVNQLLTEMDGLQARKQVFIMGATNRPDILDAAILRPGRLDKLLYVGLPNAEDRVKILNTITKGGVKPRLSTDVTLRQLSEDERCEGFSGADLQALVREASVAALKEFMKRRSAHADAEMVPETNQKILTDIETSFNSTNVESGVEKSDDGISQTKVNEIKVSSQHFEVAFEKVKPSVSGSDRLWYDEMKNRNIRRK
ncbi:nuclear valosin-containing protein-like isoform X2 [Hydractinia symbiolongicarpus]|uniref:nuclear valosin-containing protein-like isoform X2 n=1 Tax=Hydractinia symbiolongicarpus TaxID=13093 RepID=UPI00254DA7FD|nr:nuclear valosin-containing protein-like isoform X2 [Hydractinia symbiolongicarpus]